MPKSSGQFMSIGQLRRVLFNPGNGLGVPSRWVLGLLAMHANADGTCWPSMRLLSAEVGISDRSARRAVNDLVHKELVSRRRRGRGWEFRLNREAILAAMAPAIPSDDPGSDRPPRPATAAGQTGVDGHSGRCNEEHQRRIPEEGGDTPPVGFEQFWLSVPVNRRLKKAEAAREWARLTDDEKRLAIDWTDARKDSGEDVPEARFILRDHRWCDGLWPVPGRSARTAKLAQFKAILGSEGWWPAFEEWAEEDESRPMDPHVYLKGEGDENCDH